MPVTHYDIDDQYNQKNIAAAQKLRDQMKSYDNSNDYRGWKYLCSLPNDDEEGIEEV